MCKICLNIMIVENAGVEKTNKLMNKLKKIEKKYGVYVVVKGSKMTLKSYLKKMGYPSLAKLLVDEKIGHPKLVKVAEGR